MRTGRLDHLDDVLFRCATGLRGAPGQQREAGAAQHVPRALRGEHRDDPEPAGECGRDRGTGEHRARLGHHGGAEHPAAEGIVDLGLQDRHEGGEHHCAGYADHGHQRDARPDFGVPARIVEDHNVDQAEDHHAGGDRPAARTPAAKSLPSLTSGPAPSCWWSASSAARCRPGTPATSTAAIRNDAASSSTAPASPVLAATRPPRAGPTSRARLLLSALRELATARSAAGTRRGSSACSAGSTNRASVVCTASSASSNARSATRLTSSIGSRMTACAALATMRVLRRSQRSTKTPASGLTSRLTATTVATTALVAAGEPVIRYTAIGTATRSAQSPVIEIRPPIHNNAKPRLRKRPTLTSRMAP